MCIREYIAFLICNFEDPTKMIILFFSMTDDVMIFNNSSGG